ncbi:MAG: class I SAM-dependent methyltransferase [Gammaproteobacteria bacterium]|nr:class I SAM-dependent methyltransferase [Gammaproteobacteria bacterium]
MTGRSGETGVDPKRQVHDFWNQASCGEDLLLSATDREGYRAQSEERYRLEPFIPSFADFSSARGRRVLEIGVGLGADHQRFAESGALLSGIDLTERAVEHTQRRLALFGLSSELAVGDAERLAFEDKTFDIVYSWGVLHHSPDTPRAVSEVHRVLKPGGKALIMVYHKWSMVGAMLWIRYALLSGRPWRGLRSIYAEHLESPGTKAYSYVEARDIFSCFASVLISTPLSHGDLLDSEAGQRHRGIALRVAKLIWPRWLIRRIFPRAGLFMLIEAVK